MKTSQKLAVRASEIRQRNAELSEVEKLSDEQKTELRNLKNEYSELETKLQAALLAEDAPEPDTEQRGEETADGETVELRSMLDRASIGSILQAVINGNAPDGVERELQAHFHLRGNQVPLSMLETRAVTPAPSNVQGNQQPIIPAVFPQSVTGFLGIPMPTVPVGDAVFPVLTTSATATAAAKGADVEESTAAFSAELLPPSRLQTSVHHSREDAARFSGMGESLRQNISDVLSDALDREIMRGANGLLTGTNLPSNAASAETTYANFLENLAYGRVDGIYAAMLDDIRLVLGKASFTKAGATYRIPTADTNVHDHLRGRIGGLRVSAHVPAAASMKQQSIVRLGMRRDMVAPIWDGITLIPDEVTRAKQGEIVITAVMLHAVKILRAGGFHKQEIHLGN